MTASSPPLIPVHMLAALMTVLAAQSPAPTATPATPHAQTTSGIVLLINTTEVDLQIVDANGQNPHTIVFLLNQATRRGDAKKGDTVTITYVEENTQKIVRVMETATSGIASPAVRQRELGGTSQVAPTPLSAPGQKPLRKVAVLNFDYASVTSNAYAVFGTNVDIGKGISSLLANKLTSDGTYQIVEGDTISKILSEQNFSNSDRANPASMAKIGKLLGVDVIIIGDITTFGKEDKHSSTASSGFGALIGAPHPEVKAVVGITARAIDVNTGEIIASVTGRGESKGSGTSYLSGDKGSDVHSNPAEGMNGQNFDKTLIGESTQSAVAQLATQLEVKKLTPTVSGLVADVTGDTLVLNIGLTAGLHIGDKLIVMRKTRTVKDPATGAVLRAIEEKVGELTITSADADSATGTFKGTTSPKVGDSAKTSDK